MNTITLPQHLLPVDARARDLEYLLGEIERTGSSLFRCIERAPEGDDVVTLAAVGARNLNIDINCARDALSELREALHAAAAAGGEA